jgi:radical SAM superfamily enzyme YgiQ (UPF0313 family)
MYKGERFSKRSVDEVKADIDAVAWICGQLQAGQKGFLQGAVSALLRKAPELESCPGLGMVIDWFYSGMKTVFIQDANSLILDTESLVEIISYLKTVFPTIERVTSYARASTIARKSQHELKALKEAGLDRLHVGLETGDADLLKVIRKGVSPEEQIQAGLKALEAGFQLSEYWMPGLGGKKYSAGHAVSTASVLNRINPHYIRSRPFFPHPGTPLWDAVERGDWTLLSAKEQLEELREMISALEVTSKVCFDHAGNYWPGHKGRPVLRHSYEGYQFPDRKNEVLELIEEGIQLQATHPSSPPPWLSR